MTRFPLAAASLFVTLPALAQSTATDPALPSRPSAPLRTGADAALPGSLSADSPLSPEELARRLSFFYERQAALMAAVADRDEAQYTRLLDPLVSDLQLFAQRPGILLEPRFRELYSAVLTEQELFYGEAALDRGDVYGIRAAGIDAVERGYDLGAPLLEHVTLPDLGTYATTIPMDVNPKVDRYVQFLMNRRGHVERLRSRADTYFPMIERVLAEEGVPDELKYLAMVESALNPIAQSHAAAAGLWQFIRATGGAYGLRATSEIDDRLDPEASTRAAARHLRDLYDRFGDWQLALAGYNCNPAVIARAARRFEEQTGRRATFWDIDGAIPRETRAYVPMFIATTLVVSNPEAYGLPTSYEPGPDFTFDRVPVAGGTSLAAVARTIDVDEAVLRALNPSLRRGRVPDVRVPHMLRIPVGHYTAHAEALDRLAPPEAGGVRFAAESVRFGPRAVRPVAPQERGEALIAMASRETYRSRPAGTPVRREAPVRTYSPTPPPQAIAFQAQQAREAAAPVVTPEPVLVAQATPEPEPEAAAAPAPVARTPVAQEPVAAPAPVRVAQAEPEPETPANAPETAVGLVSQDLLELAQAAPAPRPAARPEREAEAPAVPVRTVSRRATRHRVARGETLTGIASQYGLSLSDLRAWNGIDGDRLLVGQSLRLTGDGAPARSRRAAAPAAPMTHTVRSGENLTRIARQYNLSLRDLMRFNGLTDGNIRPGQRLRLTAGARG